MTGEGFAYFRYVSEQWGGLMRCFPVFGARVTRDQWRYMQENR